MTSVEKNPYSDRLSQVNQKLASCERALNVPADHDPVVSTLVDAVIILADIVADLAAASPALPPGPKQTLMEDGEETN